MCSFIKSGIRSHLCILGGRRVRFTVFDFVVKLRLSCT